MRQMIADMVKAQNEWRSGKIQFYPNGWKWTDADGDRTRRDQSGNLVVLNPGRYASGCPQPPGDFPIMVHGASVPAFKCRRCPSYIKPGFCAVLRDMRKDEPDGDTVAVTTIKRAIEQAAEITK